MRAVSHDMDAARLMGINVNNTISATFAIGSALAGAAGVAVTLEIWPDMIHAFPMWNAHLEAGRRALANAGEFIHRHTRSKSNKWSK